MTPNDLRTKLTERRDSLEVQQGFLQARIDELDLVLGSLNEVPREPAPALPIAAPPEASAEKQPREKCAEIIDGLGLDLSWSPDEIASNLLVNGHTFTMRTIRAALTIAHKWRAESRAAAEPGDSATERTAREASPRSPPEGSDDVGDNLDMPGFLKRTKEAAE